MELEEWFEELTKSGECYWFEDELRCGESLFIPWEIWRKLKERGWEVTWACVAACGYGSAEWRTSERGLTYTVHPCTCHPYNYFVVIKRRR